MFHGLMSFRHRRVIAAAREQMRDSEKRNGGGEPRLLGAEISCRACQRQWIRAMDRSALDCDVEKACIFCRCKPLALSAASLDQIQD